MPSPPLRKETVLVDRYFTGDGDTSFFDRHPDAYLDCPNYRCSQAQGRAYLSTLLPLPKNWSGQKPIRGHWRITVEFTPEEVSANHCPYYSEAYTYGSRLGSQCYEGPRLREEDTPEPPCLAGTAPLGCAYRKLPRLTEGVHLCADFLLASDWGELMGALALS